MKFKPIKVETKTEIFQLILGLKCRYFKYETKAVACYITTNPKTPKNQASPANPAVMLAQKTALVLALNNLSVEKIVVIIPLKNLLESKTLKRSINYQLKVTITCSMVSIRDIFF